MSTQHVTHLLSDYAEGEINPAGAAKVKAHLTFCWSCRQALAETKDHMKELRATPVAAVPAGLEARVLARVRQEREKPMVIPEPKRSLWPAWFTPLRGFAFAATCALAVVVVRNIPSDRSAGFTFGNKAKRATAVAPQAANEVTVATDQAAPPSAPALTENLADQRRAVEGDAEAKSELGQGAFAKKDQAAPETPAALSKESSVGAVAGAGAPVAEKPAPWAAQPAAETPEQAAARAAAIAERREARRLRRQEAAKLATAQAAQAEAARADEQQQVQPLPPEAAPARAVADSPLQGSRSSIQTRTELVIDSQEEWASTWKLHHATSDTTPALPAVDFSANQVIAIFAGERPTAGYRVEITSVNRTTWNGAPARVVRYRVAGPQPGGVTAQVVTYPYIFSVQPRTEGSTFFEKEPETQR